MVCGIFQFFSSSQNSDLISAKNDLGNKASASSVTGDDAFSKINTLHNKIPKFKWTKLGSTTEDGGYIEYPSQIELGTVSEYLFGIEQIGSSVLYGSVVCPRQNGQYRQNCCINTAFPDQYVIINEDGVGLKCTFNSNFDHNTFRAAVYYRVFYY